MSRPSLDHSPGGESPGRADLPASTPRHAGAAVPASAAGPAADAAATRPVLHLGPAVVDQRPHHRRPVRALRPAAAASAVGGPGGTAAPPPPSAAATAAPPAPATGAVWRARQAGRRPRHGRELRRRRRRRPAVAGEGAPGPPPVRRREARAAATTATATLKMSWMESTRTDDQKPWRAR